MEANSKTTGNEVEILKYDYLIVGAGFAGSVCARQLADAGKTVMLIDQRDHIGGNAYDHYNDDGVLIHDYGLHVFHTNSKDVFSYLSRFTDWRHYEHRVQSMIDGKYYPFPINIDTVNKLYGVNLNKSTFSTFLDGLRKPCMNITNTKDAIIAMVGSDLYEKFYAGYTFKQWGVDATFVPAAVGKRIPVRNNHDDRYFTDEFQCMPKNGYAALFQKMIDSKNITLELGVDFQQVRGKVGYEHLIYTGSVDSYYDYQFGKLPYRSLRFKHKTHSNAGHILPVAQVNFPDVNIPYTRCYEHKQMTSQQHSHTIITHEFPCDYDGTNTPYYPVRNESGEAMWKQYSQMTTNDKDVTFLGRLGSFRYYNMDQVVAQAIKVSGALLVS